MVLDMYIIKTFKKNDYLISCMLRNCCQYIEVVLLVFYTMMLLKSPLEIEFTVLLV